MYVCALKIVSEYDQEIPQSQTADNPLVADLFLFCYEGDFILSQSDNNETNII